MVEPQEPRGNCLVVDQDGDVWVRDVGRGWRCMTQAGEQTWQEIVDTFGPLDVYALQTGDGAADAAQEMGGSLPLAVPSSLTGPGPDKTGGQPGPAPRLFVLDRHRDVSHVSGTGVVAWGVEWPDGAVSIRWHGNHPSTVAWDSVADAIAIHGHSGATEIQWLSDEPVPYWPAGTEGPA